MTSNSHHHRIPRLRILVAALFVAALTLTSTATTAFAGQIIAFEGRLQDSQRKPVSGVYTLSFSLHKKRKGGRSEWSESHFVAVDGGTYHVELGSKRDIGPTLKLDKLYLAVSLTGGSEIVREKIDPAAVRSDEAAAPTAAAPTRPTTKRDKSGKTVVDYAESAGLAYEAEHAKVSDQVGRLSEADILERLKNSGGEATIGKTKRYTSSAGGEGGVAYELKCPKGFVVTGVRGGSGIYLDSIQLICSPLGE